MSIGVGFGDLVKFVEIAAKTYKYGFSKAQRARKYRPPKRLDVLRATYQGVYLPIRMKC